MRPGFDLHERHHAADLDRLDDAGETVARRAAGSRAVPLRRPLEPGDLRRRDPAPAPLVAAGAQLAGAVPAPERLDAHADRARRAAQRHLLSPRHCLDSVSVAAQRRRPGPLGVSLRSAIGYVIAMTAP